MILKDKCQKLSYELLSIEIHRICSYQQYLFNKLLALPHVFQASENEQKTEGSKGKAYFSDSINHIENELQKLNKMEVVIAVVGTMKAGKSTTINAIVGTEVLPNRNAPMTTLPTLIRNKHGQEEPVLKLNKHEPLEQLSVAIAKKLSVFKKNNTLDKLDLYSSKDGKELIDKLLKKQRYEFNSEYQGQTEIFNFLKHLNDLMRLAKEDLIEIDPPYEAYENINDLPVIEIEFYHLKGKEESAQGSLAILDTPGPNEFGQSPALRKVFKTQLEKASAIALVIDYTQMKSESEAKVRQEVAIVTKQLSKENVYILVNKFDQANSNSMQKEEVQEYVVKSLMNNNIDPSQVYPISGQQAYLANRAKHNLEVKGKLPDYTKELWVQDFAEEAMGKRWKRFIDDNQETLACADELWNDSHFDEPLENIIQEAHSTAAEKSIKSALTKVTVWNEELKNTCSIFDTSLNTDIKNITAAVESLEGNLAEFDEVKKNISTTTEVNLTNLSKILNQLANNNKKNIEKEIKEFFNTSGLAIQQQEEDKKSEQLAANKNHSFRDFSAFLLSGGLKSRYTNSIEKIKKRGSNFDAENPILSFSKKSDAEDQLSDIQDSIESIFENLGENFNTETELIIEKMAEDIAANINDEAQTIFDKAQKELGDSGFNLNLSLPDLELTMNSFDTSSMLSNGMEQKTESTTRHRRSEGAWGTVCGWIGTGDWGWETYEAEIDTYEVDTQKIRKTILTQLREYESNYTKQFEGYLKQQFEPSINQHIDAITEYLQKYKALLNEGKKSNQLAQREKQALGDLLADLIQKNTIQAGDIKVFDGIKITKEVVAE